MYFVFILSIVINHIWMQFHFLISCFIFLLFFWFQLCCCYPYINWTMYFNHFHLFRLRTVVGRSWLMGLFSYSWLLFHKLFSISFFLALEPDIDVQFSGLGVLNAWKEQFLSGKKETGAILASLCCSKTCSNIFSRDGLLFPYVWWSIFTCIAFGGWCVVCIFIKWMPYFYTLS